MAAAAPATTDDQYVVRGFCAQLFSFAFCCAGVELGDDLFERNTALAERLTVQVDIRYRHDLTLVDLVLEQGTVDHGVGDAGIQGRHQVQRLHHIRAVVAGERNVSLEMELALEVADLLLHYRIGLEG